MWSAIRVVGKLIHLGLRSRGSVGRVSRLPQHATACGEIDECDEHGARNAPCSAATKCRCCTRGGECRLTDRFGSRGRQPTSRVPSQRKMQNKRPNETLAIGNFRDRIAETHLKASSVRAVRANAHPPSLLPGWVTTFAFARLVRATAWVGSLREGCFLPTI